MRLLLYYTTCNTKANSTQVHWEHTGGVSLRPKPALCAPSSKKNPQQNWETKFSLDSDPGKYWHSDHLPSLHIQQDKGFHWKPQPFLKTQVKRKRNQFSVDLTISLLLFLSSRKIATIQYLLLSLHMMHLCVYSFLQLLIFYLFNIFFYCNSKYIPLLFLIKLKIYRKTALPDSNTDCYIKLYFPFIYFAGKWTH